jgi:hypothetical protein
VEIDEDYAKGSALRFEKPARPIDRVGDGFSEKQLHCERLS